MAYQSKLQVIERGPNNRQFYMICPAPLAAALEMEKGEQLEWVIKVLAQPAIRVRALCLSPL